MDAEGVNLGPIGPMTMLQVCTFHGQVYIFDLMANRDLMGEGELGKLLQSENITKVSRTYFLRSTQYLPTRFNCVF